MSRCSRSRCGTRACCRRCARAPRVAVALCPDVAGELAYEPLRHEPVVALLGPHHPRAGDDGLALADLRDDRFLFYPRELAPRLYDVLIGLCRLAGFEPRIREGSFHSGWELHILSEADAVALAPSSVALDLPEGVAAVPVTDRP